MRSFNWNSIASSNEGGFKKLEAGPYVARITDMEDNPQREYVEVVFDIAEGKDAGYYSDDWGRNHPYAHHFFMSYKESALGMLKGRLEAIGSSNTGFDPFAAWDAGRTDMFVGTLVGINLQEEEYETNDGEVRTRPRSSPRRPAPSRQPTSIAARSRSTSPTEGGGARRAAAFFGSCK